MSSILYYIDEERTYFLQSLLIMKPKLQITSTEINQDSLCGGKMFMWRLYALPFANLQRKTILLP